MTGILAIHIDSKFINYVSGQLCLCFQIALSDAWYYPGAGIIDGVLTPGWIYKDIIAWTPNVYMVNYDRPVDPTGTANNAVCENKKVPMVKDGFTFDFLFPGVSSSQGF